MATSAGTVTLNLDAESVKLIRELQKASRQTQRHASKMQNTMTRAFKTIKASALSAGAAFATFGAARTVRSIAQAGLALERIELGLKAATGSANAAAGEMVFLRDEAERLGLNLESTAQSYLKLAAAAKGTTLEGRNARNIFTAVSEASIVLGLSAEQTAGALTAIEQIISKGKVSAEELRGQLGERLAGAFQDAARAIGITTEELDDLLKQGKLASTSFLPQFADELRRKYGDQVPEAADTARASFERFTNAMFDLKVAIADSGLLDALAAVADKVGTAARGIGNFLTTSLEEEREELQQRMEMAEGFLELESGRGFVLFKQAHAQRLVALNNEIQQGKVRLAQINNILEAQKQRVIEEQKLAEITTEAFRAPDIEKVSTEALEAGREAAKAWIEGFNTDQQKVRELLAQLRYAIGEGLIPDEKEQARIRGEIISMFELEELDEKLFEPVKRSTKAFTELYEEVEETNKVVDQLGFTFQSAFENAVLEGEKLSDVLKSLLKDIARIFLRVGTSNLFNSLFSGLGGGGGGGGTGGVFSGFRAGGGPVSGGGSYIVGENGPELFTPSRGGFIIPSGAGMGAGGPAVTYNIDARGVDEQRILQRIAPLLEQTVESTRALVKRDKLEGAL